MKVPTNLRSLCEGIVADGAFPITVFDGQGQFLFANNSFERLFSLRFEDFNDSPQLHAFNRHVTERVIPALAAEPRFADRHRLGFPEQEFDVQYQFVKADRGDPFLVALFQNVGETVNQAERALRQQQRFFDFAECSSDWMWEIDTHGTLTFISDQFTRIAGCPPSLFIGTAFGDLGDFVRPEVEDFTATPEFRNRRPFRDWIFEITERAGAKRQQRLNGMPVFDDHGGFAGFRGTGTDITEQYATERALRTSRDQLDGTVRKLSERSVELLLALEAAQAANRTQTEFLANVSHELRTPLNAIIGFAEVMAGNMFGPLGSEKYQSYVQDIHTSATHLHELITDVLELSKVESGNTELRLAEVDIHEEIRYCIRMIEVRANSKKLKIEFGAVNAAVIVQADRRAVRQMLTNLLSNAVKFTPEGGAIRVTAHQRGGKLEISVVDSGIGILPADLENITRPFARGSQKTVQQLEGTGLGLAVTKSLAELHGGGLQIESNAGKGTAVTITLPATQPEELREMTAA